MTQKTCGYETAPIPETDTAAVRFLYNTVPGRILLKLITRTIISKIASAILGSRLSRIFIKGFIKRNNINMEEYTDARYKSFNDFFIREVKDEFRPLPHCHFDVAAPCDGKLTVYPITNDRVFNIKHSKYTVDDLLADSKLADEFSGGLCLIFRLTPDDYHRYCYIDDGEVLFHKRVDGILHTVRPIAFRQCNVFCVNSREYTVIQTKNFGKVVQIEIGALFVGKITNHNNDRTVTRGARKGLFQFGGSTIIMLFQKNTILIDETIYTNTLQHKETIVKMGYKIGEKIQRMQPQRDPSHLIIQK